MSATSDRIAAAHGAYLAALTVPVEERAGWLRAVAEALEAHRAELVPLAVRESHLGAARLEGELTRTVFQLRLLADEIAGGRPLDVVVDHVDAGWGMGPRPDLRRMNVPVGVVGVFGASNFPFAFSVAGGDTASALAAGCAVVHKVHEAHEELGARTGAIVVDALAAAGAPDGLFSVVFGREAAVELVEDPLTAAIGFTGSTAGGRALFDRAMRRPVPIPFYGELGSINPVFVTEHAWATRRQEIIAGFVGSFTLGVGQFCTKPGVLVVPEADRAALQEELAAVTEVQAAEMLTDSLRERYAHAVEAMAARPGVEVLAQGSGRAVPTVLVAEAAAAAAEHALLTEEMFGPASLVLTVAGDADLVPLAERFEGQLTATVHGERGDDVASLVAVLARRAGRVLWNGWPTGVSVTWAQHHGGPYPASTAPATTSVGTAAITRFLRPVAFQDFPADLLPPVLRDGAAGPRRVDGR